MTPSPKRLARSTLDRAVYALVTRGWDAIKLAGYETTVRQQNKALSPEVTLIFASIDAKATGLLTHTSIMIAGLGLLAPLVADSQVDVGVAIAEIAACLLIAITCLQCLLVFRTHEFVGAKARIPAFILHELIIRRELYSLCIRSALVLTILVFLLLAALYFWTPGK